VFRAHAIENDEDKNSANSDKNSKTLKVNFFLGFWPLLSNIVWWPIFCSTLPELGTGLTVNFHQNRPNRFPSRSCRRKLQTNIYTQIQTDMYIGAEKLKTGATLQCHCNIICIRSRIWSTYYRY